MQGGRKNFYLRYLEIILYIVITLGLKSLKILKGYPFLLFLLGVGVGCSTDEQGFSVMNRASVVVLTENPCPVVRYWEEGVLVCPQRLEFKI